MTFKVRAIAVVVTILGWAGSCAAAGADAGLVGHWKLRGDCRDYSGQENHGVNHGVDLDGGAFDGAHAYIEVPTSDSLKLGTGDFAICAWVYTRRTTRRHRRRRDRHVRPGVTEGNHTVDQFQRRRISIAGHRSPRSFWHRQRAFDRLARLRSPESYQQLCQQLA